MFTCGFCIADGGDTAALTFPTRPSWVEHLLSQGHRDVQRKRGPKKTFANWDAKRTVIASGIRGLKSREMVNFFSQFGDLQNFCYITKGEDGTANNCKALFEDVKVAKMIHKMGKCTISGRTFQTRLQNQTSVQPLGPGPGTSSSTSTPNPNQGKLGKLLKAVYGKSEGGYDVKKATHHCRICQRDVGRGEETWIQHLVSEEHLGLHRSHQALCKVLWDPDKTVQISQTKGVNCAHILRYVTAFGGPVLDFSYLAKKGSTTNFCHVLMATSESREKLVKGGSNHVIGPERKKVTMGRFKAERLRKFKMFRNKILREIGIEPQNEGADDGGVEGEEDQNFLEDGDSECDDESEDIQMVTDADSPSTRKRKLNDSIEDLNLSIFQGKSLEEQLALSRTEFGWTEEFVTESLNFVDSLLKCIQMKHKQSPFGDLTTGLGLKSRGELHLLIDFTEILEPKSPEAGKTVVDSFIKNCGKAFETIQKQVSRKQTIDKISTTESEIQIFSKLLEQIVCLKLRISNSLPVQECKLFKFYCDFDSRILPLTFLLAFWASANNVWDNAKQTYPNQLIILLTIFYLQHKENSKKNVAPVLPTVQKLQECLAQPLPSESDPQLIINGNVVSFCSDLAAVKKIHPNPLESLLDDDSIRAMSILGLLKDFFQFFATVNLKEFALCTRFGYLIPKSDFQPDKVGNLPGDLCRVYRFGSAVDGANMKRFLISQTPLCVQHPFDLTINCTRGVTPSEVSKFQQCCKEAWTILSSQITSDSPDLTAFFANAMTCSGEADKAVCNEKKKIKISIKQDPDAAPIPTPKPIAVLAPQQKKPEVEEVPVPVPTAESTTDPSSKENQQDSSTTATSNNVPTITQSPTKSRANASDFFESKETQEEVEVLDHVSEDEDDGNGDGADEDDDDDSFEKEMSNDVTGRNCTLTLNHHLYLFFERNFASLATKEQRYEKMQLLFIQFILEFNQKFWTNCFGLTFLPKVGEKYWPEEFAKIYHDGNQKTELTLEDKLKAITDGEKELNLGFAVKSDGKKLHKFFTEPQELLQARRWKKGSNLTDLSLQLYEEVEATRIAEIKDSSYAFCNPKAKNEEIFFECRLIGGISKNFLKNTPLATLTMNVPTTGSFGAGISHSRINVIKTIYRRLGMTYVQKMVKRWLSEGSDFDEKKADNFVQARNEKWNAKGKKNRGRKRKFRGSNNSNPSPAFTPKQPQKSPSTATSNPNPTKIRVLSSRERPEPPLQLKPKSLMPNPQFQKNAPSQFQVSSPNFTYDQTRGTRAQVQGTGVYGGTQFSIGVGKGMPLMPTFMEPREPPQQYFNNSERLLRNPGPQGTRTFLPPEERSSQPREVHLLPNPTFHQGQGYQQQQRESYPNPMSNRVQSEQSSFYSRRPIVESQLNEQYLNPLASNHLRQPRYEQPEPQQLNFYSRRFDEDVKQQIRMPPQSFQENPYSNMSSSRQYASAAPAAPTFESSYTRPERSYDRGYESPAVRRDPSPLAPIRPQHLFQSPQAEEGYGYGRGRGSSRYFDIDTSPNSNNGQTRFPLFSKGSGASGGMGMRPQAPRTMESFFPRLQGQKRKAGFVTGGYLSSMKGGSPAADEDDLDIEYEADPRGRSSPLPPPMQRFKVGAPFPVPGKSSSSDRSPEAPLRRGYEDDPTSNLYGYSGFEGQRRGALDLEGERERQQNLFVSKNDFEGFGINPTGGMTFGGGGIGRGRGRGGRMF